MHRIPPHPAALPLAVLVAVALAPSLSRAQAPAAEASAEPVAFEINVCLASDQGSGVDPECESLQDQLPVRFNSMRVQHHEVLQVPIGTPTAVALPTGSQIQFRPITFVSSLLHMHVAMPGVVDTRAQVTSGHSIIVAGMRHESGRLIIELRPTFSAPTPVVPRMVRQRRTSPSVPDVRRVGSRGR